MKIINLLHKCLRYIDVRYKLRILSCKECHEDILDEKHECDDDLLVYIEDISKREEELAPRKIQLHVIFQQIQNVINVDDLSNGWHCDECSFDDIGVYLCTGFEAKEENSNWKKKRKRNKKKIKMEQRKVVSCNFRKLGHASEIVQFTRLQPLVVLVIGYGLYMEIMIYFGCPLTQDETTLQRRIGNWHRNWYILFCSIVCCCLSNG